MGKEGMQKLAKKIRGFSLIVLSVIAVLLFIFSILSGAESFGEGAKGIINNFPNTIYKRFRREYVSSKIKRHSL